MIKGNQRCNGVCHSTTIKTNLFINNSFVSSKTKSINVQQHDLVLSNKINNFDNECYNVFDDQNKLFPLNIKDENFDDDYDSKSNLHSIIGIGNDLKMHKVHSAIKPKIKKNNLRGTYHETLQRIDPCNVNHNHYQQHWFSGGLEKLKLEDRSRQERLEITRYELRRHLKQILQCNVGHFTTNLINASDLNYEYDDDEIGDDYVMQQTKKSYANYDRLVAPRNCDVTKCNRQALPCTIYCLKHIMNNKDQVLFNYCTAKFADNRQCSAPVFDILHELPLCPEHARKRDNYKMYQETKPKKLRKKVKASAMIRPQKRSKKKKKIGKSPNTTQLIVEHPDLPDVQEDSGEFVEDMVEQVLAMDEPDELELAAVDHTLVTQATHLLEEPDITNVLNTIQADEFSDFFTVNRNGEYEPTREETEELERALAAVDNDVKSLEKLSQSHGLLDTLIDEHTLVESLVQIPDMFHNGGGYVPCGSDSMVVTQTTSRLLQVEPHSQS